MLAPARVALLTLFGATVVCAAAPAQAPEPKPHFYDAAGVAWSKGPPSLPAGAEIAVLEGIPGEPGPFTFRLRVADGYRIAPHWHPAVEHVTVLSGTFFVGQGDKVDDASMKELPAGGLMVMPVGMRHYAWAKGRTVIQVHGVGPWGITYVNPADDPRTPRQP